MYFSHIFGTSVPILVFIGLSVLDLCPMYATDVRCASTLNVPYPRGGDMTIIGRLLFKETPNKAIQKPAQYTVTVRILQRYVYNADVFIHIYNRYGF